MRLIVSTPPERRSDTRPAPAAVFHVLMRKRQHRPVWLAVAWCAPGTLRCEAADGREPPDAVARTSWGVRRMGFCEAEA